MKTVILLTAVISVGGLITRSGAGIAATVMGLGFAWVLYNAIGEEAGPR